MALHDEHERGYDKRTPVDRSDNPGDPNPPGIVAAFDLDQFHQTIQKLGMRFEWSRALACPCQMARSNQPDPSCGNCYGSGWWHISPEASRERHLTRSYIPVRAVPSMMKSSFNDTNEVNALGLWYGGEMQLTVHHDSIVGWRDKFKCLDQTMPFSEVLIRDANTQIVAVGNWGRTTAEWKASMRYEPLRVNFVVDEDDNIYRRGPHWDLRERTRAEPTRLYWKAGQGPADTKRYSVHYDCHPVWIVADATYGIQASQAPAGGSKGALTAQVLPTTFKVMLDFLTDAEGS